MRERGKMEDWGSTKEKEGGERTNEENDKNWREMERKIIMVWEGWTTERTNDLGAAFYSHSRLKDLAWFPALLGWRQKTKAQYRRFFRRRPLIRKTLSLNSESTGMPAYVRSTNMLLYYCCFGTGCFQIRWYASTRNSCGFGHQHLIAFCSRLHTFP